MKKLQKLAVKDYQTLQLEGLELRICMGARADTFQATNNYSYGGKPLRPIDTTNDITPDIGD